MLGLRLTRSDFNGSDRSSAGSLAQMSGALTLVQSFRGDPDRNVPSLWTERLGVQPATDLWRRYGRSIWWQAWSGDGDAYLILPAFTLPAGIQGLQRQRVGSLEVLASDALHRKQLLQRLPSSEASSISIGNNSLFMSCLQTLAGVPAVFWTADALATISGTLAPLLQQGREGCVRLQLQSDRLFWDGVVGERPLSSATQRMSIVTADADNPGSDKQFSNPTLLQIDGRRLDLILGTLLSRQIIQAPLEEHYGINGSMRSTIADQPFALRLRSRESGAYKAGLQIQLPLKGPPQQWLAMLEAVSDRLQSRGFQQAPQAGSSAESQSSTLWQRQDDDGYTIVGGWQIINGLQNNAQQTSVLSIGFGMEPDSKSFLDFDLSQTSSALGISGNPRQLVQLGLLGGLWPKPVQQATGLTMAVNPLSRSGAGNSWWRINGALTLRSVP